MEVFGLILFLIVIVIMTLGIGIESGRKDVLDEMYKNKDISENTYKKYYYI